MSLSLCIIASADGSDVRCILLSLPESSLDASSLSGMNLTLDGVELVFVDSRLSWWSTFQQHNCRVVYHSTLSILQAGFVRTCLELLVILMMREVHRQKDARESRSLSC